MRKIFIISMMWAIVVFTAVDTFAQQRKTQNLRKYDRQWIHFGFSLGINHADFIIRANPNIRELDSVFVVQGNGESGFSLGIVSNLRLGPFFDLRFVPALSFSQRALEYTLVSNSAGTVKKIKKVESTFLEFPLDIKYKSVRIQNGRAYVLAGARYYIDLASQKDVDKEDEELVKLKKFDIAWEVGVGIDCYLKYFKFSPVLMLSLGMNNMLVKDETNVYSKAIDRLTSKIFQLSFTFE